MIYRPYGRTGKQISVIGFGGMRFPTPVTDLVVEESVMALVRAHALGINYFDTAPLYCGDRSEEIFGLAVKTMEPGSFYVSTKSSARDGGELRRNLERSLNRLGLSRINFFHIWCLVHPEEWSLRKRGGAVDAALKAKDEGLIEHLVFSSHLTGDETADIISEGIFEGVTLGYNAINFPYRSRAVQAAAEHGIGVVAMNPLGGGLIPEHAGRFEFMRAPGDKDVVIAALRFNVSNPSITSTLVGMANREHVEHAVSALEGFEPRDEKFLRGLEQRIEDNFNDLCTGCGYCMPCPANVPIPKYMDAYNTFMLDGRQAMLDRLKWHWEIEPIGASECIECGQCETACTQRLPIIQRLREITPL